MSGQTRGRGLFITFDAFDTLFKARRDVPRQYLDIARKHKLKRTWMQVYESFPIAYKNHMERYPNYGKHDNISVETWWKMVVQATFYPTYSSQLKPPRIYDQVPPIISSEIFKRFSSKSGYQKFKECNKLLAGLKDRDWLARRLPAWDIVRTGVISNSDLRVKKVLDSHKLDRFLDVQVYSYVVDAEKPDRAIFDKAKEMATKPYPDYEWTCLHIGDKYIEDFVGARMAGWKSLLVSRQTFNGDIPQHLNISSLKGLVPYAQELGEKLERGEDIYNDPTEICDFEVSGDEYKGNIISEEMVEEKRRRKEQSRLDKQREWAEKQEKKQLQAEERARARAVRMAQGGAEGEEATRRVAEDDFDEDEDESEDEYDSEDESESDSEDDVDEVKKPEVKEVKEEKTAKWSPRNKSFQQESEGGEEKLVDQFEGPKREARKEKPKAKHAGGEKKAKMSVRRW